MLLLLRAFWLGLSFGDWVLKINALMDMLFLAVSLGRGRGGRGADWTAPSKYPLDARVCLCWLNLCFDYSGVWLGMLDEVGFYRCTGIFIVKVNPGVW